MQVSRGDCVLHLSEHHGDACPGAALRIAVDGLEQFHAELQTRPSKYARPGVNKDAIGGPAMRPSLA